MPEASERIAELRRELDSHPASRQFYQLGELLRRDGHAAEAITVLRAGLVHHPRYVAAWVALARACLDRSIPADAATALHEALELDAHNPVAWRLLGEARLGSGDRFGALDAMQHALQLAPGDEVLRAAVDALASETWPPGPSLAPAASPDVAPRTDHAPLESLPVPAPVAAPEVAAEPLPVEPAPELPAAPPPVAAFAADEPPAALPLMDLPRSGKRELPAASLAEPFADVVPVLVIPPVPAASAAGDLDDPFAVTATGVAPPAGLADVFALPAEPAVFADEPFGAAVPPAVAMQSFLDEVAIPAPPAVLSAAATPWLDLPSPLPVTDAAPAASTERPVSELFAAPTAEVPSVPVAEPFAEPAAEAFVEPAAEVFAEPALSPVAEFAGEPEAPELEGDRETPIAAAVAPEAEAVPPTLAEAPPAITAEPADLPGAPSLAAAEDVLPPPVDFAATSAFAASPLDVAAEELRPYAEVEAPPPAGEVDAVVEGEAQPEQLHAVPDLGSPWTSPDSGSRPTLTLARLHLQQQDFAAAIAILDRIVTADPDNTEARDLLDLVHDMMAPLPGELPSLSARERKIAALQGWLASLTLGQERMAR